VPRVPVHTTDDAPAGSVETLQRLGERVGKVINIFAEMAHAPALLKMYDTTETLLREESSLDEATRQAIHLTVANVNECGYCQAAYTGAARAAGFDVEQTRQIRRGELADDARLTALLAVCREVAAKQGHVDDATWQAALDAGWSTAELLEGYADVIRTIMTNYFNHMVGSELDLPEPPALD